MTAKKSDFLTPVERVPFMEGVELVEFVTRHSEAEVAPAFETATHSMPRSIAVLSRHSNVMRNRIDPIRVFRHAVETFQEPKLICRHVGPEYIHLLFEVPRATVGMIAEYGSYYWVLGSDLSQEELKGLFGPLRRVFDEMDLKVQLSHLLKSVNACCRHWREYEHEIIVQVFRRA